MNSVFVSYSGSRIARTEIYYALREHGINPWRDVEDLDLGDDTTDTIEAELKDCSGAILWINDDVFDSDYVAKVELPAIERVSRTRDLRIVPVFDGVTPREGAERISHMGIEVGEKKGHVVQPGADQLSTAAEIAATYVRGHVKDARGAGADPVVRIATYDDTAALRDTAVLNLDWRHCFVEEALTVEAERRLRSALETSTRALKATYGPSEITIAVKSHLSLAVALGHAFAQPTGCTLRFHRDDGDWTTPGDSAQVTPLDERRGGRGPIDVACASVEVSVTRDVDAGVTAHVADGNRYRHRIILTPTDGPGRTALDGPITATGWARQIGDVLTRIADLPDVDCTDLYLATPVELAAMIGWWANAAGHIALMDWGKTGPYRRLWELP